MGFIFQSILWLLATPNIHMGLQHRIVIVNMPILFTLVYVIGKAQLVSVYVIGKSQLVSV